MGEMCDFEAEYYPEAWNQPVYRKSGKLFKKEIVLTLNRQQYDAYKAIGAVGLKKLLENPPAKSPI